MAACLLLATCESALPQVQPHLNVCIEGGAQAGLHLGLGFLFPCYPLSHPSYAETAHPPLPPMWLPPTSVPGIHALGWDQGWQDPAQCPHPLLILLDYVTFEIWQFPIWVPDGSWPRSVGARALERGKGGGPFGCSLGSDPSSAISPALGTSLLGVETGLLGSPPQFGQQFPCGLWAERHSGELRSLGPAGLPPQEEQGRGKGFDVGLTGGTCVNTAARQGCLLPRRGWFRPLDLCEAQALSPAGFLLWSGATAPACHLCGAWAAGWSGALLGGCHWLLSRHPAWLFQRPQRKCLGQHG